MVTSHISVIIESIVGSLIYHEVIPIVIMRNENSLICPNEIHVRKLFFLVCPRNQSIIMVMIGFIIKTKIINITSGIIIDIFVVAKFTCDHNNTKNITIKKSLNGFILLVISNLYDEFANVIPAINVPISIPNHIR
ncbi:MAG: hypothetical protein WCL02_04785 [bacterium]